MATQVSTANLVLQELTEFKREFSIYLAFCSFAMNGHTARADSDGSVDFTTLEGDSFVARFNESGWYVLQRDKYFESGQEMLGALSPLFRERWVQDLGARLAGLSKRELEAD